jgi:hypothetical protein
MRDVVNWPGVFAIAAIAVSTGATLGWLYGLIVILETF